MKKGKRQFPHATEHAADAVEKKQCADPAKVCKGGKGKNAGLKTGE